MIIPSLDKQKHNNVLIYRLSSGIIPHQRGGGAGIRLEVDVRTTLEAMNLPLSSEGAQEALFRMRWWTKKESSAEDGKGRIKHTKRI